MQSEDILKYLLGFRYNSEYMPALVIYDGRNINAMNSIVAVNVKQYEEAKKNSHSNDDCPDQGEVEHTSRSGYSRYLEVSQPHRSSLRRVRSGEARSGEARSVTYDSGPVSDSPNPFTSVYGSLEYRDRGRDRGEETKRGEGTKKLSTDGRVEVNTLLVRRFMRLGARTPSRADVESIIPIDVKGLLMDRRVKSIEHFDTNNLKNIVDFVNKHAALTFIMDNPDEILNFIDDINNICKAFKVSSVIGESNRDGIRLKDIRSNIGIGGNGKNNKLTMALSFYGLKYVIPVVNKSKIDGVGIHAVLFYPQTSYARGGLAFVTEFAILCNNHKENISVIDGAELRVRRFISEEYKEVYLKGAIREERARLKLVEKGKSKSSKQPVKPFIKAPNVEVREMPTIDIRLDSPRWDSADLTIGGSGWNSANSMTFDDSSTIRVDQGTFRDSINVSSSVTSTTLNIDSDDHPLYHSGSSYYTYSSNTTNSNDDNNT